jgi:hypothetical protein
VPGNAKLGRDFAIAGAPQRFHFIGASRSIAVLGSDRVRDLKRDLEAVRDRAVEIEDHRLQRHPRGLAQLHRGARRRLVPCSA